MGAEIWHDLSGPLIGAVIGYFTNYIAVKMLFFPKKEILIGGHRLPFTPGAIPKGKDRLARVVGNVIGNTLVTKEDIEEKLLSKDIEEKITGSVMEAFEKPVKLEILELSGVSVIKYDEKKNELMELVCTEIAKSVSGLDFSGMVSEKGGEIIREKAEGTMFQMFLSDDLIASVTDKIGPEVQRAVSEMGPEFYRPAVEGKVNELELKTGMEIMEFAGESRERLQEMISDAYARAIRAGVGRLMESVDISGMVEEKIDAMAIDDLEEMVLHVMKKELNMIVNLGALIGFVLGILHIVL